MSELEAELDAVRGLLDGIDAVDTAVERRASTALAKVEALEGAIDDGDHGLVRERLPDDRDGNRRTAPEGFAETDPDTEPAGASKERSGAGRAESVGGRSRSRSETSQSTRPESGTRSVSQSPASPGAISDVTPQSHRDDGPEATSDDSLPARLRDAFR